MAGAVKGIVNSREVGGATEYKVKYKDSNAVEWVGADKVEQAHIDNFLKRKQRARENQKAAREQSLKPIKSIDKKKASKAQVHACWCLVQPVVQQRSSRPWCGVQSGSPAVAATSATSAQNAGDSASSEEDEIPVMAGVLSQT